MNEEIIAPTVPVQEGITPGISGFSAPTVLSSQAGLDITKQNEQKITQMNQGLQYTVQPGDTLSGIASKQGVKTGDISGYKSGDPNFIYPGEVLSFKGTTPAAGVAVNQINQAKVEGLSDPDKEAALRKQEADAMAALSRAQATEDPVEKDQFTKDAEARIKALEDSTTAYLKDIQTLRANRDKLAIPGVRETEIKKQLNTLRSTEDQRQLQLEKDKMSEFEGQTLGFAKGRAAELDFKASFQRQEFALKERNLLT